MVIWIENEVSYWINAKEKKLQHHFFWLLCLWFHLQIVYGLTNAIWILFIERDLYLYYHCQCSAIFVWAILWYQWPLEAQQAWLDSVWNYLGFLIKMSYWKNPHMYVYTIIALAECHQMACPMAQTVCLGFINTSRWNRSLGQKNEPNQNCPNY